ncbi:MAG: replication restart helicase PriA [Aggregatilineales bacterium]
MLKLNHIAHNNRHLMHYAEVAVNTPVMKTFHYHIPLHLIDTIQPGHLVRVSFGVAMQPGIVLRLLDETDITQTKPIAELLDPQPVMTTMHLELGLWMSREYLAPPGYCLWMMLPPGITGHSARSIYLADVDFETKSALQTHILMLLRDESPLPEKDLKRETQSSAKKLKTALRALQKKQVITIESTLTPPNVKTKTVRTVRLAIPKSVLTNTKITPKQQPIIDYLLAHPGQQDESAVREATGCSRGVIKTLIKNGILAQGERPAFQVSLADRDFVPTDAPRLLPAQQEVADIIQAAIHDNHAKKAFLLHGVTGSGKTEIYLNAIAETLAQGRQAIFLVPEIALTAQTVRRVAARFPGRVALVHGSLSSRERYDTWSRARNGEIDVIVGTRSALFIPLPDTGIVILDEEHDSSYKQSPPIHPPFYHALHVAEQMMHLNNGIVLPGSATPDLRSFHRAQRGDLHYLHLPGRIMGHRARVTGQSTRNDVETKYIPAGKDAMTIDLPPVSVVDMRIELKAGNRSMFSRQLQHSLQDVLARGQQAILFLNRRGQASYVFCRNCGYQAGCENCDTTLTYHRQGENLQCHHCGYATSVPTRCPDCDSDWIRFFGAGTQQVEAHFQQIFPDVKTVRWDADTASKPDMHENILMQFVNQEAQVMIGTQMIAKGLDLPMVTLVGVISADPGLALPDFRGGERAFQLLTQVAGRAGRGILGGEVIIQTYQPDHESIHYAAAHDYIGFYEHEIEQRYKIGYPPFRRLARLLIQNPHPVNVEREATALMHTLRHIIHDRNLTDIQMIGPVPCFFRRIDRHYRWHILLRANDPRPALRDLSLPSGCSLEIDPVNIL